ncbi:MAG: polysaccharide deacetylase family protein [Ruminiclostridium sp.]|nr:polysaccharide deacetylase family protein [Ruminiclostridium sp.]
MALTFDDGPNTTTTNQVLDLLDKYQVRASFFLIGDNINDESAKSVKRAYDMGCEINNHSKTHSYMNKMEEEDIKAEIKYVDDKVKEITGESTKFFRPPYIAVNGTMYDNIDMPFISGKGCNDWDSNVDVEKRLKLLNRQIKDGVIILLHDVQGNDKTVELLDTLIPQLLEQGYQFATVSELFEAKGVEIKGDDTNLYDGIWEEE